MRHRFSQTHVGSSHMRSAKRQKPSSVSTRPSTDSYESKQW